MADRELPKPFKLHRSVEILLEESRRLREEAARLEKKARKIKQAIQERNDRKGNEQ
jgi:hypothetical protein